MYLYYLRQNYHSVFKIVKKVLTVIRFLPIIIIFSFIMYSIQKTSNSMEFPRDDTLGAYKKN